MVIVRATKVNLVTSNLFILPNDGSKIGYDWLYANSWEAFANVWPEYRAKGWRIAAVEKWQY